LRKDAANGCVGTAGALRVRGTTAKGAGNIAGRAEAACRIGVEGIRTLADTIAGKVVVGCPASGLACLAVAGAELAGRAARLALLAAVRGVGSEVALGTGGAAGETGGVLEVDGPRRVGAGRALSRKGAEAGEAAGVALQAQVVGGACLSVGADCAGRHAAAVLQVDWSDAADERAFRTVRDSALAGRALLGAGHAEMG
jgi:hypothetical protein